MIRQSGHSLASLWIGPKLGTLHRLCLRSWVRLGHQSFLFTDTAVSDVPAGVHLRSIFEVPGVESVYDTNKAKRNPSGFSNLFRAKLLMTEPVLWLDTDVLAIQESPLAVEDHVFGFESDKTVNGAVLALPASSPALNQLHDLLMSAQGSRIIFGDLGPRLLTRVLKENSLLAMAAPRSAFYEVGPAELWKLYSAGKADEIGSRLDGQPLSHLWNEAIRHLPLKVASVAPQVGSFLHDADPEFWADERLEPISDQMLESWRSSVEAADRRNLLANLLPEQARRAILGALGRRIEAGY